MKNKPYDKRKSTTSLGSDLTTAIQNFHYSGEMLKKSENQKVEKEGHPRANALLKEPLSNMKPCTNISGNFRKPNQLLCASH